VFSAHLFALGPFGLSVIVDLLFSVCDDVGLCTPFRFNRLTVLEDRIELSGSRQNLAICSILFFLFFFARACFPIVKFFLLLRRSPFPIWKKPPRPIQFLGFFRTTTTRENSRELPSLIRH